MVVDPPGHDEPRGRIPLQRNLPLREILSGRGDLNSLDPTHPPNTSVKKMSAGPLLAKGGLMTVPLWRNNQILSD